MKAMTLCVTYTAKAGMREAFVQAVLASGVLEQIRREDGCVAYQYYLSSENGDQILLLEKWGTEEQQKAHLNQPHMETLRAIKERYIADTSLERLS